MSSPPSVTERTIQYRIVQMQNVVIVGTGHAGVSVAEHLRRFEADVSIALVGRERELPYHRPPLSKSLLANEEGLNALRPESFYDSNEIALNVGRDVTAVDRHARSIQFADGRTCPYDVLVLATGSQPRRLHIDGEDHPDVMTLRDAADARRLRARLRDGRRIAVVGGGYLGLEVAAAATGLGTQVTLIEREPMLMPRVASGEVAEFIAAVHRARGVRLFVGTEVQGIEHGSSGRHAIRTVDGRVVECDTVLVAIGATPNVGLAENSGLQCAGGILVDGAGVTSDPSVLAAGDAAVPRERMQRLESVPAAVDQGRLAAAWIASGATPAPQTPWFWSDQFDIRLQMAGPLVQGRESVLRGTPSDGKFAVFHLADGRVQAVETVNSPLDFAAGKRLIEHASKVDPAVLRDVDSALMSLTR